MSAFDSAGRGPYARPRYDGGALLGMAVLDEPRSDGESFRPSGRLAAVRGIAASVVGANTDFAVFVPSLLVATAGEETW